MLQILINFLKHIQYFCVIEFQTNAKRSLSYRILPKSGISFNLIEKQKQNYSLTTVLISLTITCSNCDKMKEFLL